MPESVTPLDAFTLSESENARRFTTQIVPSEFERLHGVPYPRVVYIAGQPGAGKSTARRRVVRTLNERWSTRTAAVVDIDRLRAFHPDFAGLERDNPTIAAAATNDDAWLWKRRAEEYSHTRGLCIVDEGTLNNAEWVIGELADLVDSGYRAEIVVLAVPPLVSAARAIARYLDQKAHLGGGRYVAADYHADSCAALPHSVATCIRSGVFARVTVASWSGPSAKVDGSDADGVRIAHQALDAGRTLTPMQRSTLRDEIKSLINRCSASAASSVALDDSLALLDRIQGA